MFIRGELKTSLALMKFKHNSNFLNLLQLAGPRKIYLFVSSFLAVISSACALVPYIVIYLVMLKMLDPAFGPEAYPFIQKMALVAAGVIVLRYALMFASIMFSHTAAFKILYDLRKTLAGHLGTLPMGYFNDNQTGKIKKILYEDVEEIEAFIAHHIPDLVTGLVLPVLIVLYLFTVDFRMALVALLPLPTAFLLQRKTFNKEGVKEHRKNYHNALENMNGTIVEYVRGMPVVKIFNQTVASFTRLKDSAYAYKFFIEQITHDMAPPWAAFVLVTSSGLFFILPFGLWFYLAELISLPTLLLFLMVGSSYMAPLFKLAMLGAQLGHVLEGVSRMDQILTQPGIADVENPRQPEGSEIEFKDVSFSYSEEKILENLSFTLSEGKLTALVGPSGAGKTTIVQLLLRMWEIQQGEILLGGVNIKEIPYKDLMNQVAFVFQDSFIFKDSVYENIRMGMDGVTRADVERAAKAAQCDGFIQNLPAGIDTIIGEGGQVQLSGGERQRVSMARVVLKDAPIVVLDEATAYNDAENEGKIQAAFAEMVRDKTVIVIAHRLSTVTDADEIIVINDGGVSEKGSHKELLLNRELYYNMWQAYTRARNWALSL